MNKKTLIAMTAAAFALTLGAPAVFADPSTTTTSTTTQAPVKAHGGLAKELGLSKDQRKEIKAIRGSAKQEAYAIKSDTTLTDAEKKSKLKDLHRQTKEQVMDVLTPDQQAQLKQIIAERRAARHAAKTAAADDDQ